MGNYCSGCGSPIPAGQGKSCSMCYGDVDHGRDGYYRQWQEQQLEEEMRQQFAEEEYLKQLEKEGK